MGPSEKSSTLPLNAPIASFVPPPAPTTSVDIVAAEDVTAEDHAPSRRSLLMRAAELGPQRLTLDNILMAPTDPVLAQKIQPRVAERRARFRTVVKVALGVCAGLCLIGTAATALSSTSSTAAKGDVAVVRGAAPAAAIVAKEPVEYPTVTKAEKTASSTPAAAPPVLRGRSAKRR